MRATLGSVEVTAADIARVPPGQYLVRRADFAAHWTAVETSCDEQDRIGCHDWYSAALAVTCEWIATATVRSVNGRLCSASGPVTGRTRRAYEKLIEVEYVAAEKLAVVEPRPAWLVKRPGWIEAVCATLRWAWARTGPPPLPLDDGRRAAG